MTIFERLDSGKLYKIWQADKLVCPGCDTEVVGRFADNPLRCIGGDSGEIEACAKALEAGGKTEIIDWYPTSRNPRPTVVPANTLRMKGKAEDAK